MISLIVSEAYALDYLAILEVKADKFPTKENLKNKHTTLDNLSKELGKRKFVNIISSPEYKELYEVNKHLFELVDLAKKDEVLASEVDAGVFNRWKAKRKLQDKFFKEKLSEQKLGYKE